VPSYLSLLLIVSTVSPSSYFRFTRVGESTIRIPEQQSCDSRHQRSSYFKHPNPRSISSSPLQAPRIRTPSPPLPLTVGILHHHYRLLFYRWRLQIRGVHAISRPREQNSRPFLHFPICLAHKSGPSGGFPVGYGRDVHSYGNLLNKKDNNTEELSSLLLQIFLDDKYDDYDKLFFKDETKGFSKESLCWF
ncbi:hypothetical protein LINGRAHAP2_LOCUS3931, partial [Linum grandiflorum]